jgi:hypothetical protein
MSLLLKGLFLIAALLVFGIVAVGLMIWFDVLDFHSKGKLRSFLDKTVDD